MKKCGACNKELPFEAFGKSSAKKDGYQGACKECRSLYMKVWYSANSKEQMNRVAKNKAKIGKFLYDYLYMSECVDCGEKRIPCLQFDHVDEATKSFNLADAAHRVGSMNKVLDEIAKCVVRCANCHAVRTSEQFDWYKNYK